MFCTTDDLPREVSAVCRYYITGNCRRGSSCRFMHPPPASIQQDYPYAEGFDAHPGTRWKGWHQNIIHGFTTFPTYTTARHAVGQNFSTLRDVSDNFSDFSSSEDSVAASDRSLTTAFKVMAINETVPLGPFPFHHPEFSQYHSNNIARYGSVTYPSYYREDIATNSNARGLGRKANAAKKKCIAYKTKPCKFFSANKACVQGDKCTFIHDAEKVNRTAANSQECETSSSPLPPKPRSLLEDSKARKFYPITWRVIGGGVMMGPPCRAFAAGYCPDGADCKMAHEIKIANDDISQPPSRDGSPCILLALSAEHKHGGVPTEHSSHTIRDTHGGASDDTEVSPCEYQGISSPGNQSNAKHGVSSQRRRTRSMSLPISPLILRAPYIFAEL